MSTPIASFREPVRAFLGDFNATVRKYQDSAIDSVVKTLVLCGHVPGFSIDGANIVPAVVAPRDYAAVVYKTCLRFVAPTAAAYSYATRAIRESFGNQRDFLMELHLALHEAEGGSAMFSSYQSLAGWMNAITGADLWAHLSAMQTNAPVATVTVGRDGVQVHS